MEQLSPAAIAAAVLADLDRNRPGEVRGPLRQDLLHRLETALRTAVRQERDACIEVSTQRRDLWLATEDRADAPASLRAEARHRSNEASYILDALRTPAR
jgi:hypothetical protein